MSPEGEGGGSATFKDVHVERVARGARETGRKPGAPGVVGTSTVRARVAGSCGSVSMSLLSESFVLQV